MSDFHVHLTLTQDEAATVVAALQFMDERSLRTGITPVAAKVENQLDLARAKEAAWNEGQKLKVAAANTAMPERHHAGEFPGYTGDAGGPL